MSLSSLSVRRPVLTTMLIMAFVVLGVYAYTRIKVDLFPEVEFPIVTVTTVYPGAGPAEVETQISEVLEDEVIAISDVRTVNSIAQEGVSVILIEFEIGTDVNFAAIDVKDKIDAVRFELPDDAEPPSVQKFDIQATPVMDMAISGDRSLDELFRIADTTVKDAFARVGGVSSVTILGGKEREIHVELENRRMKAFGVSIIDVMQSIALANLSVPAGNISQGGEEYSIRLVGEFESLDEIREIRIINRSGPPTRLTDLGDVYDDFKEQRELARYKGAASVGVTVQKRSDANVIETADGLYEAVERLQAALPAGVAINVVRDSSTFIRDAVRDVLISIGLGILLTAAVLFLFLHDVRSTFIAAIAMPTSIIATFLLIDGAGLTLNLMSLLGLGISLGTLVANAIVVLENISRHIAQGEEPRRAAEIGTSEVAVAVLASTMTNVMVFTPIGFMAGIVGQFFRQFGLTVVFATIFSLLVSFTLTPMLSSRILRRPGSAERQDFLRPFFNIWNAAYGAFEGSYRASLAFALRHRGLVSLVSLVALVGGLYLFRFVGSDFLPTFDQGVIRVGVEMPAGTSLDRTNAMLVRVEAELKALPETELVYTTLGQSATGLDEGVEYGQVVSVLFEERERDGQEILAELRPKLMSEIPGARLSFDLAQSSSGQGQADITIEVTGSDLDTLADLSEQVRRATAAAPGTADVRSSYKPGKPEVTIALDRRKLEEYGLSIAQVGGLLRSSFAGQVASTYRESGEEYDIRVRLAGDDRRQIEQVEQLLVRANGTAIPLVDLGALTVTEGPTRLTRLNKQRLITVEANIESGDLGSIVQAIRVGTDRIAVPPGYSIDFGGQVQQQQEAFGEIFTALILAIVLTYMLLGALLESFVHPVTIMLTLPLGLIGVSVALVTTGLTINIFSLMAVVMMVGIVVNNGILLLDYTGQLRRQGLDTREALLQACPTRLRPIIMANLAIVAGMLPQALSTSGVAVVQSSMATVLIGAVLISTVFTLFVVPVVYTWLDRLTGFYSADA